jgi:hypothetical protein
LTTNRSKTQMTLYTPEARYYVIVDRVPLLVWTTEIDVAADWQASAEYERGTAARVVRCVGPDDLRAAIA